MLCTFSFLVVDFQENCVKNQEVGCAGSFDNTYCACCLCCWRIYLDGGDGILSKP